MPTAITPNLWFDGNALEAAEFYCSIFPNSEITNVVNYTEVGPGEPGTPVTVEWTLDGNQFVGINGGPMFTFSEAVSFEIRVQDQAELDRYWDALTADGGEESQCGWLKDRFGVSWQVVPESWVEMATNATPEQLDRVMRTMYTMQKLDIAALEAAYEGREPASA